MLQEKKTELMILQRVNTPRWNSVTVAWWERKRKWENPKMKCIVREWNLLAVVREREREREASKRGSGNQNEREGKNAWVFQKYWTPNNSWAHMLKYKRAYKQTQIVGPSVIFLKGPNMKIHHGIYDKKRFFLNSYSESQVIFVNAKQVLFYFIFGAKIFAKYSSIKKNQREVY